MKTTILTSVSKYTIENLRGFVESLGKSGYAGKKVALLFTCEKTTINYLQENNFEIDTYGCKETEWGLLNDAEILTKLKENVFCDRFYRYWKYLEQDIETEVCITIDCRDVFFQRNPEEWLNENLYKTEYNLVTSCENMKYEFEEWNKNNMVNNFPELYKYMREKNILNAGVIAGKKDVMADLCKSIYLASIAGRLHSRSVLTSTDQSAYNILMAMETWSKQSITTDLHDSWAAQLGTYALYGDNEKEWGTARPIMIGNNLCTPNGDKYYILHQYDRIKWIMEGLKK